ncbi:MAG: GlxA family transcriptional regulator [Acidobacteria bacterium]|nr:GlxA family transcriptional regulator [Acidobacteriota bacterium]
MTRRIVIVLFDGFQPLDVVGPHEVFSIANEVLERDGSRAARYLVERVAAQAGSCRSESGLVIEAEAELPVEGRIDTIVVPGGEGSRNSSVQEELGAWLAEAANRADRIATVCSGAFIAARAGLCDGRRVTTHWRTAARLAREFPEVEVDPDPIYIRDGKLWTSAGISAGIDLCLALVEQDHGPEVAQWVARVLVVPLRRFGGQSQFAAPVWSAPAASDPIRAACTMVQENPAGDHVVTELAKEVGMSPRHFTRRFSQEIGDSPARYVEAIRVDHARRLLELESVGLDEVARRCGFGSAETLRRSFHRKLRVSPNAYRRQNVFARN